MILFPGSISGPAERFLKWGRSTNEEKLERSERSERSVNGVGSKGGAPGSSEVLYICIQSDGTILRPFCNTVRPHTEN